MTSPADTLARGRALVGQCLNGWGFGLDHARARLGCCHYESRKITCSTYLIAYLADDEVEQVILHEIAHALAGESAGHGEVWLRAARQLGYMGGRVIDVPEARLSARWRGACTRGHVVLRHRKPSRRVFCGACARSGERKPITWEDRGLGLVKG